MKSSWKRETENGGREGELLKYGGESLEGNLGLHLPSPYMIFTESGPHFSGRSLFCGSRRVNSNLYYNCFLPDSKCSISSFMIHYLPKLIFILNIY